MIAKLLKKLIDRYKFNAADDFLFAKYRIYTPKKLNTIPTVLVQTMEDYHYYTVFAEIVTHLKKDREFRTQQMIPRGLRPESSHSLLYFLKSRLVFNWFTDNKWAKLYSSFCNSIAFRCDNVSINDVVLLRESFFIWKSLDSKEALIDLSVDGVYVGDLINDSYLRFKPAPTVAIDNSYLWVVIWQCLRTLRKSEKYFSTTPPKIFLTAYSTYIQHGVPVRVAIKHGVEVFSFGNAQEFIKKLSSTDKHHTANHSDYKYGFNQLNNKDEKLKLAEQKLAARTLGKIDTATAYMRKSAYEETGENVPDVKGAIVIFLHDFFDSPHVYNWMLFPDFLEWLTFTIKIADKNNLKLFIKPHPNQISNSVSVVSDIKQRFPNSVFLSTGITNKQLVEAGMVCGISVYGTVAHELAFLGIPVICCGDHPHINFDFCHTAKTTDEYTQLLVRANELPINQQNMYDESLAFYYMRNLNKSDDDLRLLDSTAKLRKITNDLENSLNFSCYEEQIQNIISAEKFGSYIQQFQRIISSN